MTTILFVVRRPGPKAGPHSHKSIEIRNFKNFNGNNFHDDLYNQPWDHIDQESNIDRKWSLWKSLFPEVFVKHAPLKLKRIRTKHKIPWLNQNTKNLLRERDQLKCIAMITKRENSNCTFNVFQTKLGFSKVHDFAYLF